MQIFYFIIAAVLGYITGAQLSSYFLRFQNKIRKTLHIRKYRIHHDFGGLILVLLGLLIQNIFFRTVLLGFGVGLIIHHIKSEGIMLVSKTSN